MSFYEKTLRALGGPTFYTHHRDKERPILFLSEVEEFKARLPLTSGLLALAAFGRLARTNITGV